MENNVKMHSRDTISAALAECFITIDGSRYNFMQAINLEANFEKTKTKVPILGKTGKGNKSTCKRAWHGRRGRAKTRGKGQLHRADQIKRIQGNRR